MFAVIHLLAGGGYGPAVSEADEAVKHLFTGSSQIGAVGWARQELRKLAESQCSPGREMFQQAVKAALSRHDARVASGLDAPAGGERDNLTGNYKSRP